MKRVFLSLGVSALLLVAGPARAGSIVEYQGPHPIDPELSRGLCQLEGPHFHSYEPHLEKLYVQVGPYWAFVGDPVEFEPKAPKHGYYGHHPIFWVEAEEEEPYCFITGPHYHSYAPPPQLAFKLKGGVYWYVGKHPESYEDDVNDDLDEHYTEVKVAHPVVAVAPPVGFIGVVVAAPAIHVVPPSIQITAPAIRVRTPGVVVVDGHGWGHGWGHGKGKWKD